MSHNAWSRGVRYDRAPPCFGDTALQYFRQVDRLEHTYRDRKFRVYDLNNLWFVTENDLEIYTYMFIANNPANDRTVQ